MSLASRITLIVLAVMLLLAGLEYALDWAVVLPGFLAIEREDAARDVARCTAAIEAELEHLSTFCNDWSAWDDTYAFMDTADPAYIRANLHTTTFTDGRLSFIAFARPDGTFVWRGVRDYHTGADMRLRDFPAMGPNPAQVLLRPARGEPPVAGVLNTELGPMLVVSRPVLRTDNQGPIRGCLIMGRLLDAQLCETLRAQTRVSFQVHAAVPGSLPQDAEMALKPLLAGERLYVSLRGPGTQWAYTLYPDITGAPGLVIRAELPRPIAQRGSAVARLRAACSLVVATVISLLILLLLRATVIAPLRKLRQAMASVGNSADLSQRVSVERRDELGMVAQQFNTMLEQLAEARRTLVQRSSELRRANEALERDVAARRRAEAQLRVHEQKLRRLASELALAEERERRRIATLLHDHITQALTVSKLRIEALLAADGPESASELAEVTRLLDDAAKVARDLTAELSPPILYELGLAAAAEWLLERVTAPHGIAGHFADDGEPKPLADDVRVVLFQAVRELLINVVKHAQAQLVAVRLRREGDAIRVDVQDDGVGFRPSAAAGRSDGGGYGLFSITERLQNLGGQIEIRSSPGEGTRVTLRAPLASGEGQEGSASDEHQDPAS